MLAANEGRGLLATLFAMFAFAMMAKSWSERTTYIQSARYHEDPKNKNADPRKAPEFWRKAAMKRALGWMWLVLFFVVGFIVELLWEAVG